MKIQYWILGFFIIAIMFIALDYYFGDKPLTPDILTVCYASNDTQRFGLDVTNEMNRLYMHEVVYTDNEYQNKTYEQRSRMFNTRRFIYRTYVENGRLFIHYNKTLISGIKTNLTRVDCYV